MEDTGSLYLRPTWIGPSSLTRDCLAAPGHAPAAAPHHEADPASPVDDAAPDLGEFSL